MQLISLGPAERGKLASTGDSVQARDVVDIQDAVDGQTSVIVEDLTFISNRRVGPCCGSTHNSLSLDLPLFQSDGKVTTMDVQQE